MFKTDVLPGKATVQEEPVMGGVKSVQTVPLMERTPHPYVLNEYFRDSVTYRYVEVEGMPCVQVEMSATRSDSFSLSCDWSKWQGKTFAETIRENRK